MNLDVVAPKSGWKDTFIRSAKTAVASVIGVLGTNAANWTNLSLVKGAGIVGLGTAATLILNKVLDWANS